MEQTSAQVAVTDGDDEAGPATTLHEAEASRRESLNEQSHRNQQVVVDDPEPEGKGITFDKNGVMVVHWGRANGGGPLDVDYEKLSLQQIPALNVVSKNELKKKKGKGKEGHMVDKKKTKTREELIAEFGSCLHIHSRQSFSYK